RLSVDAGDRGDRHVRAAVVRHAVAGDTDGGVRLGDGDGHVALGVVVVAGGVGEGPVGRAAGDVGETLAQVQAAQGRAVDAHRAARGPVRLAVVGAAVAAHRDRGIGLGDGEGDVVQGRAAVLVEDACVDHVRPGVDHAEIRRAARAAGGEGRGGGGVGVE